MPYKDPEMRRQASNTASRRWHERFKTEDPEGYRAYMRAARKRANENMSEERRQAIREYQAAYRAKRAALRPPRESGPKGEPRRPRLPKLTPEAFAVAVDDPRHGTVGGYTNFRCRCDRCRDAQAASLREYRRKRHEHTETHATHKENKP